MAENTRTIDRTTPTHRPDRSPAGFQKWRELLFMHWEVPVDVMRSLVPAELSLDLFDGKAYVGVVPFLMQSVRPWWFPAGMAIDFLELNVRTYVHVDDQPGVYFFSLDASSRLAVWGARYGWGLPYFYARMSYQQERDERRFQSARTTSGTHNVRYRVGESLGDSLPGSLEFFLLERYLLFTAHNGAVRVGQVYHTPYPAYQAEVISCDDTMLAVAGFPETGNSPALVHYSPGVDVEVFSIERCE